MVCLVPVLFLRKKAPELALLVTLALMCVGVVKILSDAAEIWDTLDELFRRAGISGEYIGILLRSVGAAILTRLCADLCRESGSQALASISELAGSAAMLLIAMPLLQAVTELLLGLAA